MATSQKYFRDHLVLLLLSVNAFLAVAVSLFILISLSTGHSTSYIVQCRDCSDRDYVNKYTTGSVTSLLSFIVFAGLTLMANTLLSLRAYRIHRQLAVAILSLGVLLLVLAGIVSYFLLGLR
jgi:hypothetical protein